MNGYGEIKAYISGMNTLGGTREGKNTMKFADGGLLSIIIPFVELSNLIKGTKVLNFTGKCAIIDHINKMEAEIVYNPTKDTGMIKSFTKMFKSSANKPPRDSIDVNVY
jgi:hypothetical protein